MKRKLSSLKPNECIHIRTEKEARKIFKQLRKIFPEDSCDMWESVFNISLITLPFFCFVTDTGYQISKYEKKTQPNKIPASDFIKPKSKLKNRVKALEDAVFNKSTPKEGREELPEKWCVLNNDTISSWASKKHLCSDCVREQEYYHFNTTTGRYGFYLHKLSGFTEISLADFKRLVLKDEDKKPIEFNKWYNEDSGDCLAFITGFDNDKNRYTGYGIYKNRWFDDDNINVNADWKPAAKEEVKSALIAEAEKRGFKEGVKFIPVYSCGTSYGMDREWAEGYNINFKVDENSLSIILNDHDWLRLMANGKWATIIDQPKEIDWSKPGQYVSTDDGLILMTLDGDSSGDNTFSAVVIQDNRNNYCHYDAGHKSDIWLKSNFKLHTEPITINPV